MFVLNSGSGIPIYRQLVDQIRRLVAAGQLKPGDTLPSVREVASLHAVNPMTISRAYNQLEIEGVLLRKRGRPMEVAPLATRISSPIQLMQPQLDELIQVAGQAGVDPGQLPALMKKYLKEKAREGGNE